MKISLEDFNRYDRLFNDRLLTQGVLEDPSQMDKWWIREIDNLQEVIPIVCSSVVQYGEVRTVAALKETVFRDKGLNKIQSFMRWCLGQDSFQKVVR